MGFLYYKNLYKALGNVKNVEPNKELSNTEAQKLSEAQKIIIGKDKYFYALYEVRKNQKISLISNLENKLSSFQIKEEYRCQAIFNANFYDTNYRHLGLFKSKDIEYGKVLVSNLFNGFFYYAGDEYFISRTEAETASNFILQSGPVLFENALPYSLKIKEDKEARRVVVFVADTGKLYFAVLFKEEDNISGPMLADLPLALSEIARQNKITIESALNLDGGSASTFQTPEIILTEIKLIGGAFCVK